MDPDFECMTRRELLAITGSALLTSGLTSCSSARSDPLVLAEPIYYSSATDLAAAIRTKAVSSREVTQSFLDRIGGTNSRINAVVELVADRALAAAEDVDSAIARGDAGGALHGVPMTVKDSFDTAGVRSTAGTLGRAQHVPSGDATVVRRLRAAGAILLGKTNTPELTAKNHTDNLLFGRTSNPYDLDRSPGGSSGGAAAIVAVGGTAFDIGSDSGGSIRYPSHCCGVVGIKPTSGRVSRAGHFPAPGGITDLFMQVGPIARYVDDLTLILPIIAGIDPADPTTAPVELRKAGQVDLQALRVSFHVDNGLASPTTETQEAVRRSAQALEAVTAGVDEVRPPGIEETASLIYALWAADGGAYFRDALRVAGTTRHSLDGLDEAAPASMEEFTDLLARWYRFRHQMLLFFDRYDVIVCPVNASPALPHEGFTDFHPRFSYAHTFNLTGWPSVVVRAGTSLDGLPIGLQIVAAPWREDVALAVASYLETELGGFGPPPGV